MREKNVLAGTLILAAATFAPLLAESHPLPMTPPHPTAQTSKTQTSHAAEQHLNNGQRIFEQNCSRCHNAPDGFSPSISGTIVRHMRVRASLSERDTQELLRFFNH